MQYTKKLYNVMAHALEQVECVTNERDFERLRTATEKYEIEITNELKRKFPDLFDRDTRNTAIISEWKLCNSSLISDLERNLDSIGNKDELVFLVKCLDAFLEDTFYECIPIDQEEYHFSCLNDNFMECGIYLMPRVLCGWEHQNRDAYSSYSIFYYLRNFYYFHQNDVRDFTVENILMPKKLFRRAIRKGEFQVMVSSVTCEQVVETTKPYTRSGSQFISIEPMELGKEKRIKKKVLEVVELAARQEVDMLIFPEMLGTENIVEKIAHTLDEREDIPDNTFPVLTMCPTIWKEHRNFCRVLNDMGAAICEQQKHYGVDLPDHICRDHNGGLKKNKGQKRHYVKEDIKSNQKIYILHCYGIGRLAVAICKDFIMTAYLRMLVEKLKVSLIVVPSFTCNDYQFERMIPKYGILDCNVIWLNTCSARWLNDEGKMAAAVTRAFLPSQKGVDEQQKGIKDFCGNEYKCKEKCIHTYRIRLNMEEEK